MFPYTDWDFEKKDGGGRCAPGASRLSNMLHH